MLPQRILIAGGSGFLGRRIILRLLSAGHTVELLTRRPDDVRRTFPGAVRVTAWDGTAAGQWTSAVGAADAIVNLSGASIGSGRWTVSAKDRILRSRVDSTRAIVEAIARADRAPSVLVNASAVGYYGHVEDGSVTELQPPGTDFLANVCVAWEAEARNAERLGIRVVLPRTGMVLAVSEGALPRLMLPYRLFVGGPLGNGRQWLPWVHAEDAAAAVVHLLLNEGVRGPVNVAAPGAVTMAEFGRQLGAVLHRPSWFPVPSFVLRAVLGEMAGPLVLSGQRVVPDKLIASGFSFRFPSLNDALADLLDRPSTSASPRAHRPA